MVYAILPIYVPPAPAAVTPSAPSYGDGNSMPIYVPRARAAVTALG